MIMLQFAPGRQLSQFIKLQWSVPRPSGDPVVARVAVREDHFHPPIFDFDYTGRDRESVRAAPVEMWGASGNNGIRDECEMPAEALRKLQITSSIQDSASIHLFVERFTSENLLHRKWLRIPLFDREISHY